MTELPCSFLAIIFNIPKIALKICKTHFLRIALERRAALFSPFQLLRKREVKFIDNHTSTADPSGGKCPHSEQGENTKKSTKERVFVSAVTAKGHGFPERNPPQGQGAPGSGSGSDGVQGHENLPAGVRGAGRSRELAMPGLAQEVRLYGGSLWTGARAHLSPRLPAV